MGLERVRIALVRGFDIPRGPMREDALDWIKEQEDRRERRHLIIMVATIAAAIGAWLAALAARKALTSCGHLVEQREHSRVTSRVIDMNECGGTVAWT
jgi:hypothetical protein